MAFVVLNCKRGLLRQRVIGVHFISIFVIVAFIHISSISSTSSSFGKYAFLVKTLMKDTVKISQKSLFESIIYGDGHEVSSKKLLLTAR